MVNNRGESGELPMGPVSRAGPKKSICWQFDYVFTLSLFEKFAEQIPRKTFNFNNLFWALELAWFSLPLFVITWAMHNGMGNAIHVLFKHANTLFYLIRIYPLATWRAFPPSQYKLFPLPRTSITAFPVYLEVRKQMLTLRSTSPPDFSHIYY